MTDTGETTFSPNSDIDTAIKEMLLNFNEESQGRMRKAILNAKKSAEKHRDENADAGARHIFREFIPASILNEKGFAFEYEKPIQGKTPDWLDDTARLMLKSYTYERGGSSSLLNRLTSSVTCKCNKYKDIIAGNSLRFVVTIYLDFLTGMSLDDCREASELFRSVFDANDSLWAIFSSQKRGLLMSNNSSQKRRLLVANNSTDSFVFVWILLSRLFRIGRFTR